MNDRFKIRAPRDGQEWQAVVQLLRDYDEFEDKTCFTSFEEEMNNIEQLYSNPDKYKLIGVDTDSGKVVGCVAYREHVPGVVEMKRLYVIPEYRGFHLGRALTRCILDRARQAGYHSMILDTMHEMKAAQELYRHMGFHTIAPYRHQDESKVVCFEKIL
jgi:putative acetyltransferase